MGCGLFDRVGQRWQKGVHDSLPIYGAVGTANVQSLEQSMSLRRVVIRDLDKPATPESHAATRAAVARAGKAVGDALDHARQLIAQRLAEPGSFEDVAALARLDARVGAAAEMQKGYESRWPLALDRLGG